MVYRKIKMDQSQRSKQTVLLNTWRLSSQTTQMEEVEGTNNINSTEGKILFGL